MKGGFLRNVEEDKNGIHISYVTQTGLTKIISNHEKLQRDVLDNFMEVKNFNNGTWFINMDLTNYFYYNFLAGLEFNIIHTIEPMSIDYKNWSVDNIISHSLSSGTDGISITNLKDITENSQEDFSKQVRITAIKNDWIKETKGVTPNDLAIRKLYSNVASAGASGARLLFINDEIYKYQNKSIVIKSYPINFYKIPKKYLSLDFYVFDPSGSSIQKLVSTSRTYYVKDSYLKQFTAVLGKDYPIHNVYDGQGLKKIVIQCPNEAYINEVVVSSIINNYVKKSNNSIGNKNIVQYFANFITGTSTNVPNAEESVLKQMKDAEKGQKLQNINSKIDNMVKDNFKPTITTSPSSYNILTDHLISIGKAYALSQLGVVSPVFQATQDAFNSFYQNLDVEQQKIIKNDIDNMTDYLKNIINVEIKKQIDIDQNNNYVSILMEKVSGDLSKYTEMLDKHFASIYDIGVNKQDNVISNKITAIIEKMLINFIDVMLFLKNGELRFSHNDCTINNVFCNYNYNPANMESILDINAFDIKIGDLDKASLWYKGVRFYPVKKEFIQKSTDIMSNLDYYVKNFENGWFDIYTANKSISMGLVKDVEFVSYFARSAPIPIFLSYDFYIFIMSLSYNSKVFRTYLVNKIIKNNTKTPEQIFIHEFLQLLFAIGGDSNGPNYVYSSNDATKRQYTDNVIVKFLLHENMNIGAYGISNVLNSYTQNIGNDSYLGHIYNIDLKYLASLLNKYKNIQVETPVIVNKIKQLYLSNKNFTNSADAKIIITTPLTYSFESGLASTSRAFWKKSYDRISAPKILDDSDPSYLRISTINDNDNILPVKSKIYFRTNYFSYRTVSQLTYINNYDGVFNIDKFDEYKKNIGVNDLLPSPLKDIITKTGSGPTLIKLANSLVILIAIIILIVICLIYYFTNGHKNSLIKSKNKEKIKN
jgi:hypothetical protein